MALEIGKTYYIKNVATGKYLNVYGTDTVANSRNVNTYAKEDCLAQKWTVGLYGNGARVYTAINSAYALNINTSNNNCTMYLAASNSEADSVVDFLTVSASNNQYRIKMMAHNKYLSVTTSDNNAYWASSADSYSLWQLEEVSTSTAIVTTAPSAIVNQTFFIKNYNTGYNLNVYGTDTVADGRNVNVYSKENCLAQKWIVRQKSDGAKLCTAINESFTLNIDTSTNNCTMYTESSNVSEDCVLEFVPYTDATVTSADKVYRIKMANHNLYLDVESVGSGANAYWVSGTTGYSLWQFVTEADMFPIAPNAPSEIVGSTFAIKAYGTDYNLNVNGTDTVADERNVNIYSKEDCLAQRWVVRNTSYGPKIFTKIDESFALNIYTVDNNCTMYTAASNDDDSILAFEEVADMLYRIKMFNHDKYLCIDGTATSGANVIWSDTASTATLWEFIPETTMFPTPAAAPTAIVGSTFFIKNFYTGYNLNVHGTDTVANGRNVNVYSKENCLAQKWQVIQTDRGPKIVTAIDSTFALNIYSEDNPNCTMYKADVSNIDTVLEFEPYTDATITAADKVYKIKMFHHGKYLEAAGVGSGYNAFWSDSPTYPLWQFVTEEDMFPPAEEAADGIIDRTFFIQNVNTGYFLNINGNETVSNTAQVNVYAKENVQAQRWVIRNTTSGPKMLTKLNENFALNIYAKDNNCTMYDAAVSDTDTVLEIIPYSEADNIYRIKMHYHGRYLTVSSLSIGAKAYWTAVDTEPCALWKLIPESEMTFDTAVDTDTTPDSTLVNKFIPAVAGNYMVGRNDRQISEITIHHMAGNMSIESLGAMWQNPAEGASSHYGINGLNVGQYVKECNTAYTNGGTPIDPDAESSNYRAITIEVANSVASGDYPVSEDSYRRLYELVADIARRNNLGTLVPGQNLTWHSMYSYTECPGDYLRSKMQDIADRANEINAAYIGGRVYLRKHNSDEFLGVKSNNILTYVSKENATPWILNSENENVTICCYSNPSLKIAIAEDGITPVISNVNSGIYAFYETDGTLKIGYQNNVNAYSITKTGKFNIAADPENLKLEYSESETEYFDTVISVDEEKSWTVSVIPEMFHNKFVRIKHSSTNKYLTFTEKIHPAGYGNAVTLEDNSFTNNQVWKINWLGADRYCLIPYLETFSVLELGPFNNCVTTGFNMYASTGNIISIVALDNEGYYIALPGNKLFLSEHPRGNTNLTYWSSNNDDLWDISIASSEVLTVDNYPEYVTRYLSSADVIPVKYLPSTYAYTAPNNFEYFPKGIGMNEGTWTENNGAAIENTIKEFYKRVFDTSEDPINNNCLYGLYGGIYGSTVTPTIYQGAPHPGVDMVFKVNGVANDRDIVSPFSTAVVVDKGTYYITLEIEGQYIKFVHLDPVDTLEIGDVISLGTKLGIQSNKGNNVPIHLHIEASLTNTIPFDPADAINSSSIYTAITSVGDTICPYKIMSMIS